MLVAYKVLWFLISKVNMEILKKFNTLSIAQCQCRCMPLIISSLHIYMDIKSIKNDQKFQSNDEKDRLKLGDRLF